jgi:hypothetical protein
MSVCTGAPAAQGAPPCPSTARTAATSSTPTATRRTRPSSAPPAAPASAPTPTPPRPAGTATGRQQFHQVAGGQRRAAGKVHVVVVRAEQQAERGIRTGHPGPRWRKLRTSDRTLGKTGGVMDYMDRIFPLPHSTAAAPAGHRGRCTTGFWHSGPSPGRLASVGASAGTESVRTCVPTRGVGTRVKYRPGRLYGQCGLPGFARPPAGRLRLHWGSAAGR